MGNSWEVPLTNRQIEKMHFGCWINIVYFDVPKQNTIVNFVTREISGDNKIVLSEFWWQNGKLNNAFGPAVVRRSANTGIVIQQEWFKAGTPHRDDGPAVVAYDASTGGLLREVWLQDGQVHRNNDLPAVINYNSVTRREVARSYYVEGLMHRLDGPASLEFDASTGSVVAERWYTRGILHRADGPAILRRDATTGHIR